jgi:hypothetical protein
MTSDSSEGWNLPIPTPISLSSDSYRIPRRREPHTPQYHIYHTIIIGYIESWNPKLNLSSNNIDPEGGRMFIETS